MKNMTRAVIALLAAGVAAPALAQMGSGYGAAAPSQPPAPRQNEQPAPEQGKGQIKPSKAALKPLVELQKAVDAKDTASIPAKMAAAQAVVTTPEDKYILAQLQLKAAANANDLAGASAAVNAIASSGFVDKPTAARLYRGIGGSYYNAKQYPQAAAAYDRAVALDPRDIDGLTMLAESRVAEGKQAEAATLFERTIKASLAAGQKPKEEVYRRAVAVAYDSKSASAVDLARQWVSAYPGPDSWRNSIGIFRNLTHPDAESAMDLMRLMRLTGAMTSPVDFSTYLYALNSQSNFIEAQNALAKPGVVDLSSKEVSEIAASLKAKPKVTAADLAAAVKSGQTASSLMRVGDRYYGLGDYAKAAETYKQAGTKGADASLVNERVGVALAAAGDKAGATAAFKSVTGARAGVAQFWLLYLQQS